MAERNPNSMGLVFTNKKRRPLKPKPKQKQLMVRSNSLASPFQHPPMLRVYPLFYRQRMRFIVSAALLNAPITYNNLCDTIGIVTTATSFFNLFREVKINQIEMWDLGASQGVVSTLGVLWNENDANLASDGRMVSDMSLGVVPAHVKTRPSKDTLSSEWHVGFGPNITNAFALTASGGCVIDVDLSFRGSSSGQTNGAANACVGGVVGATAWRGLDGLAVAATKFIVNGPLYQL
jgi:hypothetical protein